MAKIHDDHIRKNTKDYGYSIRVGKTLPPGSVNLAYVHTDEMAPKKNLLITDMSNKIVESAVIQAASNMVYPDDTFLLRELDKPFYTSTKNIVVTDEFSIPATTQETPIPLYYKSDIKGVFDARGATVAYYPQGYVANPLSDTLSYSEIDPLRSDLLLYLGNKIRITNLDGTPLSSAFKYKVKLTKQSGTGVPANAYAVSIYTNFRGDADHTFQIRYEKYNSNSTHTADYVEILNAYPFFTEVQKSQLDALALGPKASGSWKPELAQKVYSVSQTADQQYQVYSPSQVLIADQSTRPAHQFSYRVKANLRTKLSSYQTGSLNIGIIYLNQNVFAGEDLTGVIKKVYEHTLKPPYLDFVNPHNPYKNQALSEQETRDIKKNPNYWTIDMTMPSDYLNDYDLIILTGYGPIDMRVYNDGIRTYLNNGGRIWIDNAGSGTNVLNLQNFLINIGFDAVNSATGSKAYGIPDASLDTYNMYSLERQAINRLYLLNKANINMGYAGNDPKITFGEGEDPLLWTAIAKYTSGDLSLITRTIYGSGRLIVSNCGIFRSLLNKESDDIKLAMNMVLTIAESTLVSSPWIQDHVYHRDNLFKEEYKNSNHDMYVDDRSDVDSTQIVAKKVINKSVRDALIPYMPSSYYTAKGTFSVEVQADRDVVVTNNDFEVGTYDSATATAITSWTIDTASTIPGWGVKVVTGSATFTHTSSISERGSKAVMLNGTTQAYWYTSVSQLTAGTYKANVWLKSQTVTGLGGRIGIYKKDGTLIAMGQTVAGTRDWVQVEVQFGLTATTDIDIRIGFLDVGVAGQIWIDYVKLVSIGSVFTTPSNDGSSTLYAYAVKPLTDTFDLKTQGFNTSDVTVYDPQININYTIRAFVYVWNNTTASYIRQYGNFKTYSSKVRRSDGMVNLGLLTAMLPGLNAGPEWADKSRVFYEVFIGTTQGSSDSSKFINVGFFHTATGKYFYSQAGENIIGYSEIYDGTNSLNIIVQAWTDYYTIRATKRRYAVKPVGDERIYLEYPATIDNRDSWFVRVHNGSFVKSQLNFYEVGQFASFYANRNFGTHQYALPEYDRELFKPGKPFRRVRKEIAEYIDDQTIRVQSAPLYVRSGQSRGELATCLNPNAKTSYKASFGDWAPDFTPVVYMDNAGNGAFIVVASGFQIDTVNGIVTFSSSTLGNVKLDYNYNNLDVYKRTYGNAKTRRESLVSLDNKTFSSANRNWLMYPTPVIYRLPYGSSNDSQFIAPVDTYTIDYDKGTISFSAQVGDQIFADYTYSVDTRLIVRDYDMQSGLVYLQNPIDFKDEIYVNYYYEEHFVEYRGFYDDTINQFVRLDLNPAEGHYSTLPVVRTDLAGKTFTSYEETPTAKLMNKEVYIYVVPYKSKFNNVIEKVQNRTVFLQGAAFANTLNARIDNSVQYTIRHCYSKAEWEKIQKTMPGIAQLLGVVQLREHTQIEKAVVLDTRQRGGGLKTNISRSQMKNTDPNSTSFWDVGPWDGMAYYKNGVLIIQLPKTILKNEGGQFSEKEVIDIVRKYMAYGVYPIIEYLDPSEFASKNLKAVFPQGASFSNKLAQPNVLLVPIDPAAKRLKTVFPQGAPFPNKLT